MVYFKIYSKFIKEKSIKLSKLVALIRKKSAPSNHKLITILYLNKFTKQKRYNLFILVQSKRATDKIHPEYLYQSNCIFVKFLRIFCLNFVLKVYFIKHFLNSWFLYPYTCTDKTQNPKSTTGMFLPVALLSVSCLYMLCSSVCILDNIII